MTTLTLPRRAPPTRHLLSMADLGRDGIDSVLAQAAELKSDGSRPLARDAIARGPMAGRAVALIFDKPSLRTRVSFEVGVFRLGGTAVSLNATDIGLGTREPIADLAGSLSRYVDAIVARIHGHDTLLEMAAASDVPVVNALTALEHPCQALADLLTLTEHLGPLAGRRLVFVGDGNNVAHSLLLGGALVGMDVSVVTPHGYEPDMAVVTDALDIARATGARIEVTHDPVAAVDGADAVYTDVWASMGSEHEADERRRAFRGYRVTSELLRGAPGALVMHCLPAHRGEEIDAEVLDGPRSVAFDQAENRLYVQQAILLFLLRASGRVVDRGASPPLPALSRVAAGLQR